MTPNYVECNGHRLKPNDPTSIKRFKQITADTYKDGSYEGKSLAPGGGGRFAHLVDEFQLKGYSEDSARRMAAAIGRKKYGAARMRAMARGAG